MSCAYIQSGASDRSVAARDWSEMVGNIETGATVALNDLLASTDLADICRDELRVCSKDAAAGGAEIGLAAFVRGVEDGWLKFDDSKTADRISMHDVSGAAQRRTLYSAYFEV